MKIFGIQIPMMASLVIWAITWEIIGQLELSILLPPFSHIIVRLFEIIPNATFLNAFWITAKCFLIGTLIAPAWGQPIVAGEVVTYAVLAALPAALVPAWWRALAA